MKASWSAGVKLQAPFGSCWRCCVQLTRTTIWAIGSSSPELQQGWGVGVGVGTHKCVCVCVCLNPSAPLQPQDERGAPNYGADRTAHRAAALRPPVTCRHQLWQHSLQPPLRHDITLLYGAGSCTRLLSELCPSLQAGTFGGMSAAGSTGAAPHRVVHESDAKATRTSQSRAAEPEPESIPRFTPDGPCPSALLPHCRLQSSSRFA